MTESQTRRLAVGLMISVTVVWGYTFTAIKDALQRISAMDFLATRFLLAAAVMGAVRPRTLQKLTPEGWRHGLLLGVPLVIGYVTQTYGLLWTPASVSGFITGLFLVFTPLLAALLLRRRVGFWAWLAVGVALVGVALLSLKDGLSVGRGELLTLLCAIFFALHIVMLGEWTSKHDPYALAVLQLATVGIACLGVSLFSGGYHLPTDAGVWSAVIVTGLFATAAAYFIQTWAQAHLPAVQMAVVMSTEPIFAGIFGVFLAGDAVTVRGVIGAACVLGAVYLVELGPRQTATTQPSSGRR